MNEKLGLDLAFLNEENPFDLFKAWMSEAEKTEPNDPNAFNVATVDHSGQPDNRIVLLKGLTDKEFIFYTICCGHNNFFSSYSCNIERALNIINSHFNLCFTVIKSIFLDNFLCF